MMHKCSTRYIPSRNVCVYTYMHTYIYQIHEYYYHSNAIPNSFKLEIIQCPLIEKWINILSYSCFKGYLHQLE